MQRLLRRLTLILLVVAVLPWPAAVTRAQQATPIVDSAIELAADPIVLTYNGSTAPITLSTGGAAPEFFATGSWTTAPPAPVYIVWTNTTCTGSVGDIYTQGTSPVSTAGEYSFSTGFSIPGVFGVSVEWGGQKSNCLIVTVELGPPIEPVPIELTYNGSTDPITVNTGDVPLFFATGSWTTAPPAPVYIVWTNTTCTGSVGDIYTQGTSPVSTAGEYSFSTGFSIPGVFGVSVEWGGQKSNCLIVYVDFEPIILTYNGSTAPVLVSSGDVPNFFATGSWTTAPPAPVYIVWTNTTCSGGIGDIHTQGQAPVSTDGEYAFSMGLHTPGVFGVSVEWNGIVSNCLHVYVDRVPIVVRHESGADPASASLGSLGEFVATGGFVPGQEPAIYIAYTNAMCTGSIGEIYTQGSSPVSSPGVFNFSFGLHDPGVFGIRVEYGGVVSNCLVLNVVESADITLLASPDSTTYSLGPVSNPVGYFIFFRAPGLIPNTAYTLTAYYDDCDGDLVSSSTITTSGTGVASSYFGSEYPATLGFRLTHAGSGKVSNCVIATWGDDASPRLTVAGSTGVVSLPAGSTAVLNVSNAPDGAWVVFEMSATGCNIEPAFIGSEPSVNGEASLNRVLPATVGTTLFFMANVDFEPTNCVRVITTEPLPTPTHTPTPEPTATHTPTPEPTATHTQTPEPTATHTQTPEPTATHTQTPEPTATHTQTPEPTATHTPTPVGRGSAEVTLETDDGGAVPDDTLVCVGSICQTVGNQVTLAAASGSTINFSNLEPGVYQLTASNAAPYEDAGTEITIAAGETTQVTLTLTRTAATPTPTPTATAAPVATGTPVISLPDTGSGPASGGGLWRLFMLTSLLALIVISIGQRRRYRAR